MFLTAWHCIGTLTDLPRDGDFITLDLFEHPLICWRQEGRVHTFLNVCCHRFCTLTDKQSGCFPDRMRCQYHGWEYDATGRPRKIPDAPSFRPLVKDQLKLREFRTETVGQLIFVSLAEEGPTLKEYLGEQLFNLAAEWFGLDRRPTGTFDQIIDCNWKVVVENVLESYHIATVHSKTIGIYPNAEHCRHKFHETGDECVMSYADGGKRKREEWAICKIAGEDPAYSWHHLIRYPHIVIANSCLVSYVQCVIPLSPTRCRNIFRAFHYPGKANPMRKALANVLLKFGGRRFVNQVLTEDANLCPQVQAGASAFALPSPGLISVREERIFPFQEYVLKKLATTPR